APRPARSTIASCACASASSATRRNRHTSTPCAASVIASRPSGKPGAARRMTKLLLQAIRREAVPRRPLWIMRQAGRYLPEYRVFREKHSFKALAGSPELATEVTLMPLERFPLDAAIIFADIMSPLPALGVEFDFDPGPVVADPIRDARGVSSLRTPAAEELAPEVIAALRATRAALPAKTALLGFCGAPW